MHRETPAIHIVLTSQKNHAQTSAARSPSVWW
jgi:hypothetical protein